MKPRVPGHVAVCIVVENLPVPADRRVWKEARALCDAGYQVSVICPKGPGFERPYEILDGIEIYRHSNRESDGTVLGYIIEYGWALIVEALLAIGIYLRTRFRILQACNPPDTIFLIALLFKLVGVHFIFDCHDLNPELFALRYPHDRLLYRLVCLAEHLSFRTADVVITTNDSGREIGIRRGRVPSNRIFVVQTCPELNEIRPDLRCPELKLGLAHLVIYVGLMGEQDGLDLLLRSVEHLFHVQNRRDTLFVFIGTGPELPGLKARVNAAGIDRWVKFTGALYGDALQVYFATADVGVAPDPCNALNDKLTMIKIFEYMAYGLPVVLYDLKEGRRSTANAALYAENNDPVKFAEQIAKLLDSASLRSRLGTIGKERIQRELRWDIEKVKLLKAYEMALMAGVQPGFKRSGNGRSLLECEGELTRRPAMKERHAAIRLPWGGRMSNKSQ